MKITTASFLSGQVASQGSRIAIACYGVGAAEPIARMCLCLSRPGLHGASASGITRRRRQLCLIYMTTVATACIRHGSRHCNHGRRLRAELQRDCHTNRLRMFASGGCMSASDRVPAPHILRGFEQGPDGRFVKLDLGSQHAYAMA